MPFTRLGVGSKGENIFNFKPWVKTKKLEYTSNKRNFSKIDLPSMAHKWGISALYNTDHAFQSPGLGAQNWN